MKSVDCLSVCVRMYDGSNITGRLMNKGVITHHSKHSPRDLMISPPLFCVLFQIVAVVPPPERPELTSHQ